MAETKEKSEKNKNKRTSKEVKNEKKISLSKEKREFLQHHGMDRITHEHTLFSNRFTAFILTESFLILAYINSVSIAKDVTLFIAVEASKIIAIIGLSTTILFLFTFMIHWIFLIKLEKNLEDTIIGYKLSGKIIPMVIDGFIGMIIPGWLTMIWLFFCDMGGWF